MLKCPRCNGTLLLQYGELQCLQCSGVTILPPDLMRELIEGRNSNGGQYAHHHCTSKPGREKKQYGKAMVK